MSVNEPYFLPAGSFYYTQDYRNEVLRMKQSFNNVTCPRHEDWQGKRVAF
jgi:hypothetical protein